LPFQIALRIVRLKQDKPSWGAPKIRRLARLYPVVHMPAISTCTWFLDRNGLVKRNWRDGVTGNDAREVVGIC
jgi:putative transposase